MKKLVATMVAGLMLATSYAKVELPAFFSSNMVLQQKSKVPFWGWAEPGKKVIITTSWNKQPYTATTDANGKWKIKIDTKEAGGPYNIIISDGEPVALTNILLGEVWFCSGQSNMEMPMKGFERGVKQPIKNSEALISTSSNPLIQFFAVKRNDSPVLLEKVTGTWKEANPTNTPDFSAVGYQFARLLHDSLQVPIGIITSSWGGTPIEAWMDEASLDAVKNNNPGAKFQQRQTGLFNAMINPLIGYGIRGFLWYQGEANRNNAPVYAALMEGMVKGWRTKWENVKLPFYYVQIAPLQRKDSDNGLPKLWKAQEKALALIPYSGMAATIDAGEQHVVHPADKETVAKRLLNLALAKTYNKNIPYSGPVFSTMEITNQSARVYFDYAKQGLFHKNNKLQNFEMAGEDGIFYPADAAIDKNSVVVACQSVTKPIAVRYAYKDWVVGDLYNKEGLPALPFRTDNW